MSSFNRPTPVALASAACLLASLASQQAQAGISVTQTTSPTALGGALQGAGLTVDSATITNGAAAQFGTYSGFNGSVITLGNGVVLSSGNVKDTEHPIPGDVLSTEEGSGGTNEYNAYGIANVTNFTEGFDVAALKIDFTLPTASAVAFSFVFGSMEYPDYVNDFTDAFMTFLDGTAASNQIVFDSTGHPVQVGSSFASSLTTADTSTAFTSPQGLIGVLTTTTGTLAAGSHTLYFEVGDVNDQELDSAVYLTDLHATTGGTGPITTSPVPEPSSYALLMAGLFAVGVGLRRRQSH